MEQFKWQDLTLHYRVSGNGDPVLFLHGFLEDASMWEGIYPAIAAEGFQVFCLDLPCHGESRYNGQVCEMKEMAEIVAAFIKSQQLSKPIIIGHSMGGYVGLELAKLMEIELILLHSNFWADAEEKKKDRDRVAQIVKSNKNRLIQEAIPNLFAPFNRIKCRKTIQELIEKAAEIPANEIIAATIGMRNRLPNHTVLNTTKTSIIQGDHDPIIPTDLLLENMAEYLAKEQVYIIENSGHMSIWEQPENLINSLKLILFK